MTVPYTFADQTDTIPLSELDDNFAAVGASNNISYTPAGTGAVATTVQAKLREYVSVKDFGAVGDGVTDDTAAIQAALTTGKTVYAPAVASYYKITSALTLNSNQRIFGDGVGSQIRQITSLANVISATGKSGIIIENLYLYCSGTFTNYNTGSGVILLSCSQSIVRGCLVSNHRGAGVNIYSSNECLVENNTFINSPVVNSDTDAQAFADISVVFSSSRNIVQNNICISGQGTGVLVQTVVNGNACDGNVVSGNIVKNAKVYGIVLYRNAQVIGDVPLQSVSNCVVSGNTIENVSGAIINSITSTYTYGAGIYVQGAENAVVSGNTIRQTHSGAVTFAQLLAPGAIGLTNQTIASVTGNVIDQAGMFGIDIGDGNVFGAAIGAASITGNEITNCQLSGINVRNRGRIAISNNTIDTTGLTSTGSGIRINAAASTAYPDISITGNLIRNSTTGAVANIDVNYINGLTVSGNVCDTSTVHGIAAANSSNMTVSCNTVKNHTVRGIQITSTSSAATVTGNTIVGTGSSAVGIQLDAYTALDSANFISGCTNSWGGLYAVLRGTQNATAVSNFGSAETDLMTYVLPASSMTAANDSLRITAFGICANNANAKTLKVYFGSTVLQTVSLTVSQAGAWRIQAEMIATGSAAQRCFSQLVQGGTTTLVAASNASAAEASGSAITVKVTGTGVANSDITQTGMLVQFAKG
jgi:parallel beta-helix repeat protein/putative cofactor-binding repeat protein